MAKAFGVGESQTGNVWGPLYGVPSYRQLEYRLSYSSGERRRTTPHCTESWAKDWAMKCKEVKGDPVITEIRVRPHALAQRGNGRYRHFDIVVHHRLPPSRY